MMFIFQMLINFIYFFFLFKFVFVLLTFFKEVKLKLLFISLADLPTIKMTTVVPLVFDVSLVFSENYYLYFSFSLFFIGIFGIVFNRKNLINVMLSIELMLLGTCLNFIFFSVFLGSPLGQIFSLLIITVAAADSAVGLGILVAAFYLKRNISFESFSYLKN